MTISPGEEFRIKATPSQELLRKLAYLAEQDSDAVLTAGMKSGRASARSGGSDKARKTAEALMLARLADPAYQQMSERITGKLTRMDEASVRALQEIEQELLELRRERERMLELAYRDQDGRHIFMTGDESAAFFEDGAKVEDEKFAEIKDRLHGRPSWEAWQNSVEREGALNTERDQIHAHDQARESLRDDLATGSISQEEAERREREIEQAMPERLRANYVAPEVDVGQNATAPDTAPAAGDTPAAPYRAPGASAPRL